MKSRHKIFDQKNNVANPYGDNRNAIDPPITTQIAIFDYSNVLTVFYSFIFLSLLLFYALGLVRLRNIRVR